MSSYERTKVDHEPKYIGLAICDNCDGLYLTASGEDYDFCSEACYLEHMEVEYYPGEHYHI